MMFVKSILKARFSFLKYTNHSRGVLLALFAVFVFAGSPLAMANTSMPTISIENHYDPSTYSHDCAWNYIGCANNSASVECASYGNAADVCNLTNDCRYRCAPRMAYEGAAFMYVNEVGVPFYTDYNNTLLTFCGSINASGDCVGNQSFTGKSTWLGEFIPQYLKVGANDFQFGVTDSTYDNSNVNEWHNVRFAYRDYNTQLFLAHRVGAAYQGATSRSLSLETIDPNLAAQLENLENAIDSQIEDLRDEQVDLEQAQRNYRKRVRLQALRDELSGLLESGFDFITHELLEQLLAEFDDVLSSESREALLQFLDSLHAQVDELQADLQTVVENTRAQIEAIEYAINEELDSEELDDNSQYQVNASAESLDEVEPVLGEQPVDDTATFPYDEHADHVIAQLGTTLSGNQVVDRIGFMNIVASWSQYQLATSTLLSGREYVSMEETGSFQSAVSRVRSFIHPYFDTESGFFTDLVVPQSVRNAVNGALSRFNPGAADEIKRGLNLWQESSNGAGLTASQSMFSDNILAMRGLIEALELNANADPFGEVFASLNRLVNGAATVAHAVADAAVDVGVSLIPFVGDYRDFCEMVSARKFCLPEGETLTSTDRIFAGMGVVLGSRILWEGVSSAAGEFVFNYANLMAEISDAVLHGRRPLDSLLGLLDELHGLPGGFPNLMVASDTALMLPNGTYKPIDFVYLDEAFDAQRNFQFTFNPSNASGYPSNWDEVAEWTYIVEPGTHRVRIAPRGSGSHRQSHAQLAGSGTNVQAAEVKVLMAGKLHFDPVTRKLLRADTDSGHFKPDFYPENRAWIPDYMAGVIGAHGVDPRTPFKTFDKVTHVFK